MDEKTFKERTKKLAVAIIKQMDKLPKSRAVDVVAKQIIRSGTSIGANYRAACRARSTADMINKMKIVEEEGLMDIWPDMAQKASEYCEKTAHKMARVGIIFLDGQNEILAASENIKEVLSACRK